MYKLMTNCFISLSEIMKAVVEIAKGISHQRRAKGARRGRRRRKKTRRSRRGKDEGASQAGEQAFSVRRKISQPGRGPMPVNSVGRSLTR